MKNEITYEITEEVSVLSNGAWALELNLISWNGTSPKFDLRKWTDDHSKMSKGITFTRNEALALRDALNDYFGGEE